MIVGMMMLIGFRIGSLMIKIGRIGLGLRMMMTTVSLAFDFQFKA
jgi:hypothetical protein